MNWTATRDLGLVARIAHETGPQHRSHYPRDRGCALVDNLLARGPLPHAVDVQPSRYASTTLIPTEATKGRYAA